MGNYPYLDINHGIIEVVKDPNMFSCPGTPKDRLSVFEINSRLNIPVYNFILLINKIILKFYKNKIRNIKAFIISLDNLFDFYLDEEEIKEANDILLSHKGDMENLKEKIIVFKNLFDSLEIINDKEKQNFIRSIKTILVDDEVLNKNEINTFIEILTKIFYKNIYEGKNSNLIEKKKSNKFGKKYPSIFDRNKSNMLLEKNSSIFEEENMPTQDFDDMRIEDLSNLSPNSNFSSYSKNSQHQIRKMEKEIKRLKKLIPK